MRSITLSQIACIHTLLSALGLKEEKASIVQAFTGGRTDSTKQMGLHEAQALIEHLKNQSSANHSASSRMRNKVIAMAHDMGWHLPGSGRIDMRRVNAWCFKYSHAHKALDAHTYEELPALVTQFEKMYNEFLKK